MDNTLPIKSIVLADDHAVLRQGLHSLIDNTPGFEVVAEVSNGLAAIQAVQEKSPDILIIDLTMPHFNGMDAIRNIKRINPDIKIIVLTVHTAEEYVYESLKSGADGYVLKAADFTELVTAMNTVLQHKTYLSPDISHTVVTGYLNGGTDKGTLSDKESLTLREREVLKLVGKGFKNREIADMLCVSTKTVEKHRENIKRKLNLSSTSAMIAYAIEHGLVG